MTCNTKNELEIGESVEIEPGLVVDQRSFLDNVKVPSMRAECKHLVAYFLAWFPVILSTAPIAATPHATCMPVPGLEALLQPGTVLLLGEIHGTKQGPAAVANVVCAALESELSVTVALEILQSEQTRITQFLHSGGTRDDRTRVLAGDFWQRDHQDGRGSQAMFDLIDTLRQLRAENQPLEVLLIDNPVAPQGRDRFMAQWMKLHMAEAPKRFFVALTGNLHSRLIAHDEDVAPFGHHLRRLAPETEIRALKLTHAGGTAWVCTSEECGVVQLRGDASLASGVERFDEVSGEGFTGRLHLGTIEASPPARQR